MVSEHEHVCWGGGHRHEHHHSLSVQGLSAGYDVGLALEDISFTEPCGRTLALIGPNGAGKSTLLNVLAGLMRPRSGSLQWNGRPLREQKQEIAYLPQRSEIDAHFPITVQEVVAQGRYVALGPWRRRGEHDDAMIRKAIAALSLEGLEVRQIGALSGGQLQRVFLARALAQEAHILLLDEPFTGLDVPGTLALGHLLRELAAEGRLIIAVHHDMSNVASIFDEALLLKRHMLRFGPTAEVLASPELQTAFHRP